MAGKSKVVLRGVVKLRRSKLTAIVALLLICTGKPWLLFSGNVLLFCIPCGLPFFRNGIWLWLRQSAFFILSLFWLLRAL
jgi:hypothetical protein